MAFPGDINALVSVNSSDSLATAGHAARHNEVKTALEGVRDALGGTAVTSGAVAPVLAAGAAGTPSLSFTGDANTGLWSPAADTVAVSTGGTERMRIDNAGLITGTGTSLGAWTSFTPTYTNFTIGNGTQEYVYARIGKIVVVRGRTTLGSTSSVTGQWDFTLPVNAVAGYGTANLGPIGMFNAYDASASVLAFGTVIRVGTGTVRFVCHNTSGTYATNSDATGTVPFTWASGDFIQVKLVYEAE